MALIADILMAAGAFGAAIYCYILSARLKKFSTLETGMGGAIAVLSVQVDDMTRALDQARNAASGSAAALQGLNARADAAAIRLELLLASMHDLPSPKASPLADRWNPAPESDPEDAAEKRLRFVRRRSMRDGLEAAE